MQMQGDSATMPADAAAPGPSGRDRKVVLLTGASGSIGTAFCKRFAGSYDIVAVRHLRSLTVTSQLQSYFDPFMESKGTTHVVEAPVFEIKADLLDNADIERVIEVALARYGQIDAVVNAIGASDRESKLLGNALGRAIPLFRLNALAPLQIAVKLSLDHWRHQDLHNADRNRVVVNLSAASSVNSSDVSSGTVFAATKAALSLLSLRLADELRPFNVRVMTIAPAPVPGVVSLERVTSAIESVIEGDESGRVLLMWADRDELV